MFRGVDTGVDEGSGEVKMGEGSGDSRWLMSCQQLEIEVSRVGRRPAEVQKEQ